jgi:hypothetical protein
MGIRSQANQADEFLTWIEAVYVSGLGEEDHGCVIVDAWHCHEKLLSLRLCVFGNLKVHASDLLVQCLDDL